MKNFSYKKYFVILERQHNGSIRSVAYHDSDNDSLTIRQVFYDYSLTYIKQKIKSDINYMLEKGANHV